MVLTWVLLCVFWRLHSDKDSSPDLTERQGRGHVQGDYWLHTVRSLGRERSFRCALKSQARWPCHPPSPGASCSARGRRRSSRGRRAALWSSPLSLALHKASTSWESGRWCWPGWNSSAAASPSRLICCFDLWWMATEWTVSAARGGSRPLTKGGGKVWGGKRIYTTY